MKKLAVYIILTLSCSPLVFAQLKNVDSLQKAYQKNKQDTTLVKLLNEKAIDIYLQIKTDSGLLATRQALALSRKIHYKWGEEKSLANMANFINETGDLPGSLKVTFEALPMAIQIKDYQTVAECYNTLGLTYSTLKDFKKAQEYYSKGLAIARQSHFGPFIIIECNNLSRNYIEQNQLDSALWYTNKAYKESLRQHVTYNIGFLVRNYGIIQFKKGNYKASIGYYLKSLAQPDSKDNHYLIGEDYRRMAEAYQKLNNPDSCIYCAQRAFEEAKIERNTESVLKATALLSDIYKSKNDFKNAYEYQQIMLKAQDSLFSQQKTMQVQNLTFSEQQRQQEIQEAQVAYENKVRFYALIGILAVVLFIVFILWFSNNSRKKANRLLHRQNQQIQTQHQALEKTLAELNATQTQLVQREKMASLGELTAGIAHEIQNPLNFVNNFSDVNTEMLGELEDELKQGNIEEALAVAADIKENEKKINHHGKRADFIVKGMLQHSRTSTGEKQETNINILADEFLKLSYHGLRAKDKNFNAELITHFDGKLPKVNIAAQDIGRVLLNLFNNAFYAVNQKKKTASNDYKPEVTVSTLAEKGSLVIKVKDNGNGIPDTIKDKIMQPFFTTKPTGEGTGLGLSLSYDIVVKGHGGTITVNTKENEFTEFTIALPIS